MKKRWQINYHADNRAASKKQPEVVTRQPQVGGSYHDTTNTKLAAEGQRQRMPPPKKLVIPPSRGDYQLPSPFHPPR